MEKYNIGDVVYFIVLNEIEKATVADKLFHNGVYFLDLKCHFGSITMFDQDYVFRTYEEAQDKLNNDIQIELDILKNQVKTKEDLIQLLSKSYKLACQYNKEKGVEKKVDLIKQKISEYFNITL